jgi:hypothetical protein
MSIGKFTDVNAVVGVKQSRRETILVLLDPEYSSIANIRNAGSYLPVIHSVFCLTTGSNSPPK